jgi:hypothetical protein
VRLRQRFETHDFSDEQERQRRGHSLRLGPGDHLGAALGSRPRRPLSTALRAGGYRLCRPAPAWTTSHARRSVKRRGQCSGTRRRRLGTVRPVRLVAVDAMGQATDACCRLPREPRPGGRHARSTSFRGDTAGSGTYRLNGAAGR